MRIVIPTTRYKKDLKKYAKQPSKMEALLKIIRKLEMKSLYRKKISLISLKVIIRDIGNAM